jgi:hypothetical protein
MVEDPDIEDLRAAAWEEQGIYEATTLIRTSTTAVGWKPLGDFR